MTGFEPSSMDVGGARMFCGCGLPMNFGFDLGRPDAAQKLLHADGTELCVSIRSAEDIPVVPGSARADLAEARLLAEIDLAEDVERSGPPFTGVLLLYALLMVLVVACGYFVVTRWPA